jgi:hypothetical protein
VAATSNGLQKIEQWLLLPESYIPWLSRLTGLLSLPVATIVWFFAHSGVKGAFYPQPFSVPTWRLAFAGGDWTIAPPLPPEPLNIIVFTLFALGCILLMAGKNKRAIYIYMASVLAYYTAIDWFVACFFWVLLDFLFLAALAFRAPGEGKEASANKSATRRLIQLTLASCYLFGVVQKALFSDFDRGISLESFFHDGFAVTAPFKDLFISHPMPAAFWQAASTFLLYAESFIGLGLFFKKTRLIACGLGLFLHGGIIVMMEPVITIFSLEMWTGYLAFFDKKTTESTSSESTLRYRTAYFASALIFVAALVLMPARIYFLPGPPEELLTLFDRTPWTFGMFLMRQKVASITISYDDKTGQTHSIEPSGRIETFSNDNELSALARYVKKEHNDAQSISINDLIIVNERRQILKTLIWKDTDSPVSRPVIRVASAGDYCRGAANKDPDCGHRP